MRGAPYPKIYLYREVVDFRKSINGLCVIVEQEMALSPFEEAVFLFCNRRRDKLKLLYWDKSGFCLWYKRLEQEKFHWPRKQDEAILVWKEEQFQWLLRGLNVLQMKDHKTLKYREVSG